MEIIRIGTDNTIGKREIQDVVRDLQDVVGGFFEIVRPQGMRTTDYVMIVNESGLMRGLPENRAGSSLYRHTIVGDIVIMPERFTSSGPDLVGFRPGEAETVIKAFLTQAPYLRRDDVAQERKTEGKSEAGPEKEEHKAFLVAEHPRRSLTGFHLTAEIPVRCQDQQPDEALVPGYAILHDHRGPGENRNVTNMFGTLASGSFEAYGDCVLVKIRPDEESLYGLAVEPMTLKEIDTVMESFGFPKDAWFTKDMLRCSRDQISGNVSEELSLSLYAHSYPYPERDMILIPEGKKEFAAVIEGRTYAGRILDSTGNVLMAETPWIGSSEPIEGPSAWHKGKIDMNDIVRIDERMKKDFPDLSAAISESVSVTERKISLFEKTRQNSLSR